MRPKLQLFVMVSSVFLAKAIGETANDELLISTELSEVDNRSNELDKKEHTGSGLARQVKDLIELALDSDEDRNEIDKWDAQGSYAHSNETREVFAKRDAVVSDSHSGVRTESNQTREVKHMPKTVHNHVHNNEDPTHMNNMVVADRMEDPAGSEGDIVDNQSSKHDSKEDHKHKDSNEAREIDDEIFTTATDEVRGVVSKASESHVDMADRTERRVKKTADDTSTEIYKEKLFSSEEKKTINDLVVKKDPLTIRPIKRLNNNISNIKRSFKKRSRNDDATLSTEYNEIETSDDFNNNIPKLLNSGSNSTNVDSIETIGFSILNTMDDDFLPVTQVSKYDLAVRLTTEEYEDYYEENRLVKEETAKKKDIKLKNESKNKKLRHMFTERPIPEMLPSQIPTRNIPIGKSTRVSYDITVADIDQPNIKWDLDYRLSKSTEDPTLLSKRTRHPKKQSTRNNKKTKMLNSNKYLTMFLRNATDSKALNYDFSIADIDQPKAQWVYADEKVFANTPSVNKSKLVKQSKILLPSYYISVDSIQKPDIQTLYTNEKLPAHSENTEQSFRLGYLRKTNKMRFITSTEYTVKPEHQYNRSFMITKVPVESPTKTSFDKSPAQYTAAVTSSADDKSLSSKYRSVKHVSHYGHVAGSVRLNSKTLKPNITTKMHEEFVKKCALNGISGQATPIPRKTTKDIVSTKVSVGPHAFTGTNSTNHHKYLPNYTFLTEISSAEIPSLSKTMNLDIYETATVTQIDDGKSGSKTNAIDIFSDTSVIEITPTTNIKSKSYNLTKITVIPLINEPAGLNKTSAGPKYDKNLTASTKKFLDILNTTKMNTSQNNSPAEIRFLHKTLLNATVEALQKEPWDELAKISNKNAFIDEAIQILFDRTFRHTNSKDIHINNTSNTNSSKLGNTTKERYIKLVNKQLSNITEKAGLSTKAKYYISDILNTMITKSYLNEPLVHHIDHLRETKKADVETILNKHNKSNWNDTMTVSKNNYDNVSTVKSTINLNVIKHISTTQRTTYRSVYKVSENTGISRGGFLIRNKYKANMHNLYSDDKSESTTNKYSDNTIKNHVSTSLPATLDKIQKTEASSNASPDHKDEMTPAILNDAAPKLNASSTNDPKSPKDKNLSLLSTTVVPVTTTSNNITNSIQDKKLSLASTIKTANVSEEESQRTSVTTTTPKSESCTTDDEEVSTNTVIKYLTTTSTTTHDDTAFEYDYDAETTTDKSIRYSERQQKEEVNDIYPEVLNFKKVTPENNNELTVIPHSVAVAHIKSTYPHKSKKTTTSYEKKIGTLDLPSKEGESAHLVENISSEHGRNSENMTLVTSVANQTTSRNRNETDEGDGKDATDMNSLISFSTVEEKYDDADVESSTTGDTKKLATYMVYTTDKENYNNSAFSMVPYNISQKLIRTSAKQPSAVYYDHRKEEPKHRNVLDMVIKNPLQTRLASKYTAKEPIKKVDFNLTLPCKKSFKKAKHRSMTTPIAPENSLKLEKKNVSLITMEYHLKSNKTKLTTVKRLNKQISKANQDTSVQNKKIQSAGNLRNLPDAKLQMIDTVSSNKSLKFFQVLHKVTDLLRSVYEKLHGNDSIKSNVTYMVLEPHGDMHSKLLNEMSPIMNDSNFSKETTDNSVVLDTGKANLYEPHILDILKNVSSLLDSIHKKIPEHNVVKLHYNYSDVPKNTIIDVSKILANDRPSKALFVASNNVLQEKNLYDNIISKLTTEKINEMKILKVLHNVSNILVSINNKIPKSYSLTEKKSVMLQSNDFTDDGRVIKINHSIIFPESDFHKRPSVPVVSTTDTIILKNKTHINTTSEKVFDSHSHSNMILKDTKVENLGIIPDIEKLHTEIISEHIKKIIGVDPNSLPFEKGNYEVYLSIKTANTTVAKIQKNEALNDQNFSISTSNKTNDNTPDSIVQKKLVDHAVLTSVTPKDTSVTFNSIWMEQGINDTATATVNNNWPYDDNKTGPKEIVSDTGTINQDNKNDDIEITSAIIPKENDKVKNKISSPNLNAYFNSLVKKLVFNEMSDPNESQLQPHGVSKLEVTDRSVSNNTDISVSAETKSIPVENDLLRNLILNSKVTSNNILNGVSEAALEKEKSYQHDLESTIAPHLYSGLEISLQKLLRNENIDISKNNLLKQDELFESTRQVAKLLDNTLEKGVMNEQHSRRKSANLRDFEHNIRKFVQNLTIGTQNMTPTYNQQNASNQNDLSKSTTFAPVHTMHHTVEYYDVRPAIKNLPEEKYNTNNHFNQKHNDMTQSSANYQNLNRLINLLTLLAKQSENANGERIPIMNPLYNHKLKSFSRLAQKDLKHFHSRPMQDVLKHSKTILSWRKLLLCLKKELLKKGKNYMNCFFQNKTLNIEAVTPVAFTTSPASTTKSFAHAIHELKKEIEILKKQTKMLGTENLLKYQYNLLPFLREFDETAKNPYSKSNADVTQSLHKAMAHRPTSNVLETLSHYKMKNEEIGSILGILNKTRFEKKIHHYKHTEMPMMQRGTAAPADVLIAQTTTGEIETIAFPVDNIPTHTLTTLPRNIMTLPLIKKYTTTKEDTAHHKVVPLPNTQQTQPHNNLPTTMEVADRYTRHFTDTISKEKSSYTNSAMETHYEKPIRSIASSKPAQLRSSTPVEEFDKISSNEAEYRTNVKPMTKQLEPKLYVFSTSKPLSFMDATFMIRTKESRVPLFNTTTPIKYPVNPASKHSVESHLEPTPIEPALNLYSLAEQSEPSDPTTALLQNEIRPDLSEEEAEEDNVGKYNNASQACGVENSKVKSYTIERYPWYGVLMYSKDKSTSTSVVLVTREFVIASAIDIERLSKQGFRRHAKVVLGRNCTGPHIGVINYNYHPVFHKGIVNTIALVQIDSKLHLQRLRPICSPPTTVLLGAHFVAVVLSEDCGSSKIITFKMEHVPLEACREFYRENNRDSSWPLHFACGRALRGPSCVWRSGTSLVLLQNKRWHLLGFGVAGPGCGAPSRFIDFGAYWQWVASATLTIGQPAITTVAPNHIILRRAQEQMQRYGPCDPEERKQMLFTDSTDLKLPDENNGEYVGKALYNLTIFRDVVYSCIDLTAHNVRGEPEPPQMDLQPCYAEAPRGSDQIRKINFCLTILFKTAIKYKIVAYGQPRVMNEKKKFKRTHNTPQFITPNPPKDNYQPDNNIHRYRYSKLKKVQSNIYNSEGRVLRKYEKKVRHRSMDKRSKSLPKRSRNLPQKLENYDVPFGNAMTSIDYIVI